MNKNDENCNGSKTLPILYSLRNCPYAMRARVAIFKSQQAILLRDVVLNNKPQEMVAVSAKATVPVLVLENGVVIDESLEVMLWALQQSDPDDLMHDEIADMLIIIDDFDNGFKTCLEQYKCEKRYLKANIEKNSLVEYRQACEQYLQKLELRLIEHTFIMSDKESLVDIALLPFIRQFAQVERQWYLQSPYPKVRQWLNNYLQSPMFTKVMAKQPLWLDNHEDIIFVGK